MGIEKMLRMYLLQIWFNLSDPATEDAIYDSYAMRKFTGIDFMTETVPDETTLCKFLSLIHIYRENPITKTEKDCPVFLSNQCNSISSLMRIGVPHKLP